MNKKKLLALIAKKNERKAALTTKADTCEDVAELRKINAEVDALNTDIRSLQEIVDSLPDDEGNANHASVDDRTAAMNGGIPGVVGASAHGQQNRRAAETDTDSPEYRRAFQEFVTRGTPIPTELRANANTLTPDVETVIPTQLYNRIVEKVETTGMILPLVTRTTFPSGIVVPTSSVKPVATWVLEGKGSDRQKKTTGSITFSHFKLRCEISMSAEASAMVLSVFETNFVRQVSEAMVKAMEMAILNGDGTTQPKGILKETPEPGQALTAAEINYKLLLDAEAAIPQAYESGSRWCMTKPTFMRFFGITDSGGQPIARVNYGISGVPERVLLGRDVVLCGDYMDSFSDTLPAGAVFAFIFNFSDYALNTIYDLGIVRKQDWDTEDMLTKAVMSMDGKVIDKQSLVTLAKAGA